MLMAGIGRLEGIEPGLDLENDVDHVLELQVARAGTEIHSVAGVKANAVLRKVTQGMVQVLGFAFRPFAVFGQ